jgi:hypothetical protein
MKWTGSNISVLTLVAALTLVTPLAHGDIVYSNLGPGGTYNQSNTYWYHGILDGGWTPDQVTVQFIPLFTAQLTQIEIPLLSNGTNPDYTIISLDVDNNGVPGTNLENWLVSDFPLYGTTDNELQTLIATSNITLTAGTDYWIIASAEADYTYAAWNQNVPGEYSMPAYEVDGTPPSATPEPMTVLLTLPGLFAICSLRRRCRA